MEGHVLLQGMAQLWKGLYCRKAWRSYGRACIVARHGTVMERSVLLQGSGTPLNTKKKNCL